MANGREEAEERFRRASLAGYRPDSAPTVLDISPEGSLQGPPTSESGRNGEEHEGATHGEDLNGKLGIMLWYFVDSHNVVVFV